MTNRKENQWKRIRHELQNTWWFIYSLDLVHTICTISIETTWSKESVENPQRYQCHWCLQQLGLTLDLLRDLITKGYSRPKIKGTTGLIERTISTLRSRNKLLFCPNQSADFTYHASEYWFLIGRWWSTPIRNRQPMNFDRRSYSNRRSLTLTAPNFNSGSLWVLVSGYVEYEVIYCSPG